TKPPAKSAARAVPNKSNARCRSSPTRASSSTASLLKTEGRKTEGRKTEGRGLKGSHARVRSCKHLEQRPVEGVEVGGLAAAHQHVRPAVAHPYLFVDPVATGVANIGLQARPRRQRAVAHAIGFDDGPGPVADDRNRASGVEETPDEIDGGAIGA